MSGPVLLVLRILFTISLYAFLAYGLYILWMDTRRQVLQQAARQPSQLLLTNLSLADSQPVRFSTAEIMIGRDPSCGLSIDDITVSAQHARLVYRQRQWWLDDLRSTNGTYLNQEPVKNPMVVTSGDELRCGQVKLSILIESSQADGSDRWT
jgi:pSer/pThr/pTyr-binding forkhead associated (FHA) protein